MNRKKILAAFGAALLTLCNGPVAQADPAHVGTSDAYWWWFEHVGSAKIIRTDTGISGNIRVNIADYVDNPKGMTVTLWIVIFNNADQCVTANMCFDPDLFDPAIEADVVYGGGNVVGASGTVTIGFRRAAGDNSGSVAQLFGMPVDADGESFGLRNPRYSEVHYVIRFHGPKNPAYMPDQINSYPGGCVAFAPYGWPFPGGPEDLYTGDGDCQDVIFAINPPPAS